MTAAKTQQNSRVTDPEPVRVCFPVTRLGYGGAERQLVELALGLDKREFQVVVVPFEGGGPLESELTGQPGVCVHPVSRKGKFDMVSPTLAIARIMRAHRVQIVQPFITPATLYGLMAAYLSGVPIRIATERCGDRVNTGLGNRLYRRVEDWLTRRADMAIANSEAGCRYLGARGISPDSTMVIYNGVNDRRLTPDAAKARRIAERLDRMGKGVVLGNVARHAVAKRIDLILKAVAAMSDEFPDVRVALVGDGPEHGALKHLAGELGISDRVEFFGSDVDVAPYIQEMDIAVLPSADVEGCSNFLLEAMGMGKPAVASDFGGNPEVVLDGDNGFIVPANSLEALVDKLRPLIAGEDLRQKMGARSREIVETRFSLSAMVQSYRDVYMGMMHSKLGLSSRRNEVTA